MYSKYAIPIIGSMLIVMLGWFYTNRPKITFVEESNSTPVSSTITWTTTKKTTGCVYLLAFPPRVGCNTLPGSRANHLVELNNLKPTGKELRVLIQSGTSFQLHTLATKFIPETMPGLPQPVYGSLIHPDTKAPVVGATIIIETPRGLLSTTTNDQGKWSVSLTGDYETGDLLPLKIAYEYFYLAKYRVVIGNHQPSPPITPQELKGFTLP